MTISLSPETQKLLETEMKKHGCATPEETVRLALEQLAQDQTTYIEDLDPQTQVAIAVGLAQANRGEGRPWQEVREELRTRFIKK